MRHPKLATLAAIWTVGALVGAAAAQGGADLDQARAMLTGKVARQWVLKAVESVLSPGDACSGGAAARFKAAMTVQLRTCQDGKLVIREVPWTLKANGVLDPILTFDGVSYELYFQKAGATQTMRLRIPGRDKAHEAKDFIYRLSK